MPDPMRHHRAALEAMTEGSTRRFTASQGEDADKLRLTLCGLAHRTWGKGTYQTRVVGQTVHLTRHAAPAPPVVLHPDAANDRSERDRWLSREEAAAFLSPLFPPDGLTAEQLRRMAVARTGPPYSANGRRAIYRLSDLRVWGDARIGPPLRRRAA